MRALMVALLLQGGGAAAAAPQPKPLAVHAVQCLLVTGQMAQSADPTIKQAGTMAMTFYMGQLFGADPDVDVEKAMLAEALRLTPERSKALARECGTEMQKRGQQVQAAGTALMDYAKKHPQ